MIYKNAQHFDYDADGNMTYGPLGGVFASFAYDPLNQLVSADELLHTSN